MKYTLNGFSQEVALTFKKTVAVKDGKEKTIKIDCTDLTILRWFVDFYPNMRKMNVDGKEYAWLTHKKLIDDLPILDISKRSCVERMQKLVEFEILEYTFVKDGGTFSLYRFGKNYEKLISSKGMQSNVDGYADEAAQGMRSTVDGGVQSNVDGVSGQTDNKDNSFSNSSFNHPSTNNTKKKANAFDAIIESYTTDSKTIKLLNEWLKVRKAKRVPTTENSLQMNLAKLDSLAEESKMTVPEYLLEVIRRGWAAFYPIVSYGKKDNSKTYGKNGVAIKQTEDDDLEGVF